jgi:hypothetical protein
MLIRYLRTVSSVTFESVSLGGIIHESRPVPDASSLKENSILYGPLFEGLDFSRRSKYSSDVMAKTRSSS